MPIEDEDVASPNTKWTLSGHPDRISGSLLVIVACFAISQAANLPYGSLRKPDAGFFPLTLSILLLIFALGIAVNSFITKPEPTDFSPRSWYVVVAGLAFIVYALALEKIGFVLATIAIMLLMMRGLGGMRWGRALLITIPSVLLSYLAFVQLGVPLPRGLLPF